jgi:GNAT superfamily N-acetyltransferase
MSERAALADHPVSPLAGSLFVTSEWRRPLLEPLLWQLRERRCGHLWQPALAAAPTSESFRVFERQVTEGRPTTVYTYYVSHDGHDDPVAVATISPRVARDSPEDGIPVLGRVYVRPEYRGQSVYRLVLRHRLDLCRRLWGQRLLGVHIGTSSSRVETVFRMSFPGRTIRLGDEDLGDAGVVTALIGLTAEFDRQIALPVPGRLTAEHRLLCDYLARGGSVTPVAEVRPALRALAGRQDAYRLLNQFLEAMPNLR